MSQLTVSDAARRLNAKPKDISTLFYVRALPDGENACPIVGGRRMIPLEYLDTIRMALKRAGKPVAREVAHA